LDRQHNAKVLLFLEKKGIDGATISEIVDSTSLSRDNVRIAVACLEGAGSISMRTVGKAKLYRSKSGQKLGGGKD